MRVGRATTNEEKFGNLGAAQTYMLRWSRMIALAPTDARLVITDEVGEVIDQIILAPKAANV